MKIATIIFFLILTFSINILSQTVIPYQLGWPRTGSSTFGLYHNSPTIDDIDQDGSPDISVTESIVSSGETPRINGWKHNGTFVPGYPAYIPFGTLQSSGSNEISAMGDVTGDGFMEIVWGDENGRIFVFNYMGEQVEGSPYSVGSTKETTTPALVDLDSDDKLEIIITSYERNGDPVNAQLHVLTYKQNIIDEFRDFPLDFDLGSRSSPVVGDIDKDNEYEIVFVSNGSLNQNIYSKIHAIEISKEYLAGFPIEIAKSSLGSTPVLWDLDQNGTLEIIIRAKPEQTGINGIYAYDYTGQIMEHFPFPVFSGHPDANVAIADMTGDGIPEIAFGNVRAVDSAHVFVWDLEGNLLPNYPVPVYATWVDGSVAIGDVSGDGLSDVIAPTNDGLMYAFDNQGNIVDGFPVEAEDVYVVKAFECSPTLVDIDDDGDLEIFAGSLNKRVYGYDTPGMVTENIWSTFKGNPQRTGGQLKSEFIPVELVSFTANIIDEKIVLNWKTATETNNSGFEIQKMQMFPQSGTNRQNNWQVAGFVNGNGTTTEENSYSFIDNNLSAGKYKYRLKQIDLDGTFEYSNIVEVSFMEPFEFLLEQNYPNPFNPTTTVKYTVSNRQLTIINVYDVLGNEVAELVNEYKEPGSYEVEFNAGNLPSGIYFIKMNTGNFQKTIKAILMK